MKIAPIQIGLISFRRMSVELDEKRLPEDPLTPPDVVFDFEKVAISTNVGMSPLEDDSEQCQQFFLILHIKVENKPSKDKRTRFSPYLLDFEAGATVKVLRGAEAVGDIRDLVAVNGTGLLWSAIREQVAGLTARMPAGAVTLPTVNFRDLRKQSEVGADNAKSKPRKKRSRVPG